MRCFKSLLAFFNTDACCDGEDAHMVWRCALWGDEVGQATARAHHAVDLVLLGLLAQTPPGHGHLLARLIGIKRDVIVVDAVGRPKTHDAIGGEPTTLKFDAAVADYDWRTPTPLDEAGFANLAEGIAIVDGICAEYGLTQVLHPHLAHDDEFISMFLDEARLAATLHHHNVVQVNDIGEVDGKPYFAMEYVHGHDLRHLLAHVCSRREHIPLQHVITIVAAVTDTSKLRAN